MLLEADVGAPILGVDIGIFGSASAKDLLLAVLHPRRLVVYGVTTTKVQSEMGEDSFMTLQVRSRSSRVAK